MRFGWSKQTYEEEAKVFARKDKHVPVPYTLHLNGTATPSINTTALLQARLGN